MKIASDLFFLQQPLLDCSTFEKHLWTSLRRSVIFSESTYVHLRTYKCWKMSKCSKEVVAQEFSVDSFRHLCCQRDFCNKSPSLINTAPLGISAVIVVWMMSL